MEHHNDLCDGVSNIASKALTPTHVHNNPKIYTGCAVRGGKEKPKGNPLNDKGDLKADLLIRELWTQGTESIYDMCVVNTEST